jgi:drug/metabolite transporter (DMT)-like permease
MLEGLFQWMEAQAVYGGSPYIGPVVNLIHLLSMVLFMGALLMVDLRLLGLGLRRQPLPDVARDAQPWLIAGLVGIVLTGIPQTMERATDQYETSMFWVKMYLLLFGIVWMVTVRRHAVRQQESSGAWPKVVGLVSILAFMGVAALARLIMLLPANTFEFLVG